jgi:hypothetical protein
MRRLRDALPLLLIVAATRFPGAVAAAGPAAAIPAFGLYPAGEFHVTTGACSDCATIRQALWYFRTETIAAPNAGLPASGFTLGVQAFDDVRQWAQARPAGAPLDYPPLVWIAAPQVVRHARIEPSGTSLRTTKGALPFRPVAKIPLNRSYSDAS